MARVRLQCAALLVTLVGCCAARNSKSITYLRLGPQIVEQSLATSRSFRRLVHRTPLDRARERRLVFTEEQADRMVFGQVNDARASHSVATLRWATMPEQHGMVCGMARGDQMAPEPFESLLNKKHLSGMWRCRAAPIRLTPEQLQGLKVGRFHKFSLRRALSRPLRRRGLKLLDCRSSLRIAVEVRVFRRIVLTTASGPPLVFILP
jgi:hypothetical protein